MPIGSCLGMWLSCCFEVISQAHLPSNKFSIIQELPHKLAKDAPGLLIHFVGC